MIGERIKNKRIELNMSQDELAEKLYVTRQTVSNYELGKTKLNIETVQKIAEIFNCELVELIEEETNHSHLSQKKKYLYIGLMIALGFIYIVLGYWLKWLNEYAIREYDLQGFIHVRHFRTTFYMMFCGLTCGYLVSKICLYKKISKPLNDKIICLLGIFLIVEAFFHLWIMMEMSRGFPIHIIDSLLAYNIYTWNNDNHLLIFCIHLVYGYLFYRYQQNK